MAAATEVIANEAEIKEAMSNLRLGNWADDVLNEIELNRRLKISLEQADRGEVRPAEMVINELLTKLKNGSYDRR
jgi:hypothetical protein